MASEEQSQDRNSRKQTQRRKTLRRTSLHIPERFKDGDDAQDDVTAPKKKDAMSMNQSIFSMIARAGQQSQADLGNMQELDSGDSEDESKRRMPYHGLEGAARLSRISTSNDFQHPPDSLDAAKGPASKHQKAASEHKLLRSLPKLKMSGRKENKTELDPADGMSSSQLFPPRPSEVVDAESPLDEDWQHKSKVTAGRELAVGKGANLERKSRHGSVSSTAKGKTKAPVTLAQRLQQIFEFESLEEVISGEQVMWNVTDFADSSQSTHVGCCRAFCCRAICTSRRSTSASMLICQRNT
jgi:sterol 3beta-glucosyltransferase